MPTAGTKWEFEKPKDVIVLEMREKEENLISDKKRMEGFLERTNVLKDRTVAARPRQFQAKIFMAMEETGVCLPPRTTLLPLNYGPLGEFGRDYGDRHFPDDGKGGERVSGGVF